ncbi:MAG: type I glyceraldehyde-3-phosphate dehydrogenase [Bacteroidia bacterium]|nr:type I glyceraldehyde-3-phosphate dehydrogenase [Bacteroidia bacterium]
MIRIAINGFGRIGRNVIKILSEKEGIEVIAINDLTDPGTLAHLLKYDSVHGRFNARIAASSNAIIINGKSIPVFTEKDPSQLPWREQKVDVVIESTGKFTDPLKARAHIEAGATRVIISAPARGEVKTIVPGLNDELLDGTEEIVSCASCTTNNAAPMIQLLDENWGIESAHITTVHAYTGDQNLQDAPHRDLRRARAAAHSIIPTSTGAAKALTMVFPHLAGKLGGAGIRVPVINGSITDITCIVKKETDIKSVNQVFREAAAGKFKNILEFTDEPIVSVDIIGNPYSCIFDSKLTSVLGRMVKVVGWYDNEMGYSHRLTELALKVGKGVLMQ